MIRLKKITNKKSNPCRGRHKGGWACATAGAEDGLGGTELEADIMQKIISRRCRNLTRFRAGLRYNQQQLFEGASPRAFDRIDNDPQMSRAVSRTLANAVDLPKHNGNGDNRFAIIIQGSGGDIGNDFEQDQFEHNVQEMARILTEHPRNIKPGPGYTGYYLQDQMYFAQSHDKSTPVVYRKIPEIEKDVEIPKKKRHDTVGKTRIFNMIKKVALKVDSYDDVLFFYTSHGRPHDWLPYKDRKFLFDANNHHQTAEKKSWESANDAKWSTTGDIWIKELDNALDPVICHKMTLILQPCYSGNWINYNSGPPPYIDTYKYTLVDEANEKNRVVITSEVKAGHSTATDTKKSIFDKCNIEIDDSNVHDLYWVGQDANKNPYPDNSDPKIDGEEYVVSTGQVWKCWVKDIDQDDDLYEIDDDKTDNLDPDPPYDPQFNTVFQENFKDEGTEMISGLTEAIYINRDSNSKLDADEDKTNGRFSTNGDSNEYISCKEAYKFMKLWHFGMQLNKNPWIDKPQITYTDLEVGNNYIF